MSQSCFSLGMSRLGFAHFEGLRILGQSHRTVFQGFVHYGSKRKVYGKSVRNIKGDLIHYDAKDCCIGFSVWSTWGKITHYDSRGKVMGYSRVFLGFLLIHYESNKKGEIKMSCYKVRFDDYCLAHHEDLTYFNFFEVKEKKYSIGAYVKLTQNGEYEMLKDRGHGFLRGNFRLVDHFINDKGVECWEYIIGKSYDSDLYYFRTTTIAPDELIDTVLCSEIDEATFTPEELEVEFVELNNFPKDWEVEGVMSGWIVMMLVWVGALVFKDWWVTLVIQIVAGFYFGSWGEKKINEAISKQKLK